MNWLSPFPTVKLDPRRPTGLILGGLGGPDEPKAVAPFLHNLLTDPNLVPLPRPLARVLGAWLARRMSGEIKRHYAQIDPRGVSPHLGWTRQQCSQLSFRLSEKGLIVHGAPIMRYWHPFAAETVTHLLAKKVEQFIVLPTIPQYTAIMSGGILANIIAAIDRLAPGSPVHVVTEWHLLPGYVTALVRQAEPIIRGWYDLERPPESCALIFSAQSLPVRRLRREDPYVVQVRSSVAAIHTQLTKRLANVGRWWERLTGSTTPLLAFQRKTSPFCWLRPDLAALTRRLAASGCRRLLVVPISYTCEQMETLYELDIRLADIAARAGIEEFSRGAALNLDSLWLTSLADELAARAFPGLLTAEAGAGEGTD